MVTKKVARERTRERLTARPWSGPVDDPAVCCWRFALPREEIAYVRCLLEAYEGLAQIDAAAGQGEIRWTVPLSQVTAAAALARALAAELPLVALGDDPTAPSAPVGRTDPAPP